MVNLYVRVARTTYNIGNYNRHLKSNKHFKKDSLDKLVGKTKTIYT